MWQRSSEWPPNTRTYFEKCGKIEYALDCVISGAKDQNFIHGDGECWRTFKDDLKALLNCVGNDDNFNLVSNFILGGKGASVEVNGPDYPSSYWDPPSLTEEEKAENEAISKKSRDTFNAMSKESEERLAEIFGTNEEP